MKGILIFLVVFGHALEYFRLDNPVIETLYTFIYLFHMPVFVFISGYFSKNLNKGRKTAVTNFLVPFLLLNSLLSIGLLLTGNIDSFTILNPGWTLWYFYTMFIWRLLLPDLIRLRHIFILSLIAGILAGFVTEFGTFMALARTLSFTPYFLAGYFLNDSSVEKIRQFKWRKIISWGIILLGAVLAVSWTLLDFPPEILWGDRPFSFFQLPLYQNILLDVIEYLIGFGFVFVFLSLAKKRMHFYTPWGANTLSVYLLHIYFIGPVLYFAQWIQNPWLHFGLLLIASLLTTHILSKQTVVTVVRKLLAKIITTIMPPKKEH
nr:acyltransferase family protein [Enterococcus phoeniculicola]